MKPSLVEKRLIEAIEEMEIIDCHEHLPPEDERLKEDVDIFTLFSHYTRGDLYRAGMNEKEYQDLFNKAIPLNIRWKKFAPYWEKIRWTSFSRAVLLTVEKFYGISDINEKTYEEISEKIKEMNKPGLYEKVLRNTCKIKTALTQCGRTVLGTDLLTPVMPTPDRYGIETWENLHHPPFDKDATVKTLDDYLDAVEKYILRVKKEGAVGLKMVSAPYQEPNRSKAISIFEKIKSGVKLPDAEFPYFPKTNPLKDYVVDWTLKFAGEQDLVIAVHTGYWGDFRELNPTHMIPLLIRHPNVRFDIYHAGYPYVREALMLGKEFSNVWLNFCWTHIISQRFAMSALDEAIDLIPTNKILAFGGDYNLPVEKVYGHLVMARENIAKVLGRRIEEGQMSEDQAIDIAKRWFYDNPVELYRLKV